MSIKLNGNALTLEEIKKVSRENVKVELTEEAIANIKKARDFVEKKLSEKAIIYGLTTGFGEFQKVFIEPKDATKLQENLIISHSCGMGEPEPIEVARAQMLLRINSVAKGFSGIKESTVRTLIDMLNKGVTPYIPQKGSLGSSGDLALLAHMVLPMLGYGQAYFEGNLMDGKVAMEKAGIPIIQLESKEGLALINGTNAMCAFGTLALYDTLNMTKLSDILSAMVCEAQLGISKAFDPKIHEARGHKGQIVTAKNILKLLEGSTLIHENNPDRIKEKVQDAYGVRCLPQIIGGCREAIYYVENLMKNEINAATDNPLVFPDAEEVISGGNFHGEPVAIAMDSLGIAASELASISEVRLERLVNPSLSYGLPAFLCQKGGLNNGFMIAQYASASMVSENKTYAHPCSVDSIPSSANQEDHVSMGTTAARTARMIVDNLRSCLAIELMAVCQALELRGIQKAGKVSQLVHKIVREAGVPFIEDDILMHPQFKTCEKLIADNVIVEKVEELIGKLE
ncbi:MAG: histidine ammonia-lyase [archaeon]|nr:histidine ammonia-lyase [archaeon]